MGHSSERNNGVRGNWKCILICLAMSLANCQYGYDTGQIAGFQAMVGFLKIYGYRDKKRKTGWNIATTPQQLIASFLNVRTIIGLLLTPIFAKRFGRRPGIWVACIISFVASALQLGTTSLAGLYAGRIFIGVSNGFFITFANSYTAESSPAHLRGIIVSFFGIWVNTGSLLGAITDNFSKDLLTKLSYHIPLASLYAIPFFLGILIIFIPESPRWLLIQNRPDEARKSLERLRGNSLTPELIEEEFIEMKRGIDSEQELAQGRQYTDMFKGTDLRRTLLCFAVILSHASSGLWLIISYGTFFFQIAGIKEPFKASIYTKVANLVGTGTGMYFCLKWMGRRTMMMTGHFLPALFMLGIAVAFTVAPDSEAAGKALVVCAQGYCFFYNGFSGTLSWPLLNEIVSSRLRVITIGLGTAITYVFNWLITFTTPYFINSNELNWGPKAAYIWAVSNLITGIFFFFFLPEMKGRTLEEIDELFQNRVSVRNFRKYEFISSSKARQAAIETRKELNCDNQTESSKEPEVTHAEEVQVWRIMGEKAKIVERGGI